MPDLNSFRDSVMILLVLGGPLFLGLISLLLISLSTRSKISIVLRILFAILGGSILLGAILFYIPSLF